MAEQPKLLTEAEALELYHSLPRADYIAELRERGLIAEEPEKTAPDHAWQICVEHGYRHPHTHEHNLATAALRRGIEIGEANRKELTRDMVDDAIKKADFETGAMRFHSAFNTALHAALQEQLK
jgi:hypothetical protein